MPLQLFPAEDKDIPRAVEIEKEAYGPSRFAPVLFPGPFPASESNPRAEELIQQRKDDPSTRWLKVVDSDSGESVAFAKWHIYDPKPTPKPKRRFGEGCNVEACEFFFGELGKQRDRVMKDQPYLCESKSGRLTRKHYLSTDKTDLHMLQTDPKFQRRGAGSMLIRWGLEEGDRRNLPCYLESSPEGHVLYQRYGFKDVEESVLDFSKWGVQEPHRNWAMIRQPQSEI